MSTTHVRPFALTLMLLALAFSQGAFAQPPVTPSNLQGWGPANVRADASVNITGTQPRSGNGSLEFITNTVTPGQDKADFVKYWGVVPGRTLGNLSALSYEFFRASTSTTAPHLAPAFRLAYQTTGGQTGYLIYEPVYNGFPVSVPTNTWVPVNLLGANFWMRAFGPSRTIDIYDITLAEWISGMNNGSPIGPDGNGDVPQALDANTNIIGIEVGVGSGWGNSFRGFVDNVNISFGADTMNSNFELFVSPLAVDPTIRVSDQKAGSVLVFPYYTSAADGSFNKADTLLTISNVCDGASTTGGVPNYSYLHLFFINGANCSPADTFVCLTPNGSIQIRASDYDPTVTGYLIAVAVGPGGTPVANNCFIGSAFVRDDTNGIVDGYGAESFAALLPTPAVPSGTGSLIRLDGAFYDFAPTAFSVQVQDPAVADEFIVLASVSGDLGTALNSTAQTGAGVLYRADEFPASFQPQIGSGCFSSTAVDRSKIRIVPGTLDSFLKGSYGYLKFTVSAPAVGLIFSRQGAAGQAAGRWAGIRTLHKTQQGVAQLATPMFSPFCGF